MDEPRGTLVLRAHHQEAATIRSRLRQRLAADIIDWVEHWNEDPQPFVWHKTADEILERLGRYCAELTNTELSTETA